MHKGFLDLDDERKQRFLAVDRMPLADRSVSDNASLTRDTQRVTVPRHNEEKSDIWVF